MWTDGGIPAPSLSLFLSLVRIASIPKKIKSWYAQWSNASFIFRLSGNYSQPSGCRHLLSPKSTLIISRLLHSMTDVCVCVDHFPCCYISFVFSVRGLVLTAHSEMAESNSRREEMRPTWAVYETISMSLRSRDEGHEYVHIHFSKKRFVCAVTSRKTTDHHSDRRRHMTKNEETRMNAPTMCEHVSYGWTRCYVWMYVGRDTRRRDNRPGGMGYTLFVPNCIVYHTSRSTQPDPCPLPVSCDGHSVNGLRSHWPQADVLMMLLRSSITYA